MTQLKSLLGKIIKSASVLAGAATIATTTSAFAWGPTDRTTYTNESPASYATFNSITDNVGVGDERNFVRVREAGTTNTYVDELEVTPGKEYEVYIYYHNDAGSNTNASGYGIATGVKASSAYPTVINPGERGMISGIISWSYVTPSDPNNPQEGKVWDEAYLTTSTEDTVLRYKTGTAVIHNAGQANGLVLSDSLFTEGGTYLGFNKLTGVLPGCAEYSGYITYTLVAELTASELTKEVSTDGTNWNNSITVNPGEYVTYRVTFKNTGNTTMTNVIFKDTHSDALSLRSGSTKVFDVNNTDGKQIDDILDLSGYNVGDVAPGALVQIIYQAKVANDVDCTQSLSNKISVSYNGAEQQESATNISIICTENNIEDIENPPCDLDPTLPGCVKYPDQEPEDLPDQIVNTGPVEVIMAIVIIAGIAGGGFYLWRTKHTLKTVEGEVSGKTPESSKDQKDVVDSKDKPVEPTKEASQKDSSKTPKTK